MAYSSTSSSNHQNLIDRLSNLPEHILLIILSFLPTKDAVAASVLSKPWQHLWTLVPTIDLSFHGWGNREDSINKVLDGNKASIIRRFRLSGKHCKSSYLYKWLSSATERSVEELDLDIYGIQDKFNSSPITFVFRCAPESCKTLVVMKVITLVYRDSKFIIGGHLDDIHFPSLKILNLKGVGFESRDPSLSGFFSSRFPLLEELVVIGTTFHHDFNVSLPMLRRLEINYIRKYTLNVEAPSLQYLVLYRFEISGGICAENLHNLVEANVDVYYEKQDKMMSMANL